MPDFFVLDLGRCSQNRGAWLTRLSRIRYA